MNHAGLLLKTGRNILAGIDQTNANWSHFTRKGKGSGRTELPLFGESGGAVFFEIRPALKVTFPIEIDRGGGVNGGEILQTSHLSEPQHCPSSIHSGQPVA